MIENSLQIMIHNYVLKNFKFLFNNIPFSGDDLLGFLNSRNYAYSLAGSDVLVVHHKTKTSFTVHKFIRKDNLLIIKEDL